MEKLGVECDEFPDTETGIVQRRDDRLVSVAEVRRRVAPLGGPSKVSNLARFHPRPRLLSLGIHS
jgi:hypothetical protein